LKAIANDKVFLCLPLIVPFLLQVVVAVVVTVEFVKVAVDATQFNVFISFVFNVKLLLSFDLSSIDGLSICILIYFSFIGVDVKRLFGVKDGELLVDVVLCSSGSNSSESL
jgi:hypothetical protein